MPDSIGFFEYMEALYRFGAGTAAGAGVGPPPPGTTLSGGSVIVFPSRPRSSSGNLAPLLLRESLGPRDASLFSAPATQFHRRRVFFVDIRLIIARASCNVNDELRCLVEILRALRSLWGHYRIPPSGTAGKIPACCGYTRVSLWSLPAYAAALFKMTHHPRERIGLVRAQRRIKIKW
jgi:hypothetical protein